MKNVGDHGRPRLHNISIRYDHKDQAFVVESQMRKISRKRFIGLAMYTGYSARVARGMADVIRESCLSYTEGYFAMKAFTKHMLRKEQEAADEPDCKCTESEALG